MLAVSPLIAIDSAVLATLGDGSPVAVVAEDQLPSVMFEVE